LENVVGADRRNDHLVAGVAGGAPDLSVSIISVNELPQSGGGKAESVSNFLKQKYTIVNRMENFMMNEMR
jgi:hypothetical protein